MRSSVSERLYSLAGGRDRIALDLLGKIIRANYPVAAIAEGAAETQFLGNRSLLCKVITVRNIAIGKVNVDEVDGVERAVGGDRRQRRIADVPVEFDRQAPVLVLGQGTWLTVVL